MIRRLVTAAAAVLVLAVLILVAPTSQALADVDSWDDPASCATGTLKATGFGVDSLGAKTIWIKGSIRPCDARAGSEYGFIYYVDDSKTFRHGYVHVKRLKPYRVTGHQGHTKFTRTIEFSALAGGLTALCLAYDYYGRVACIGVTDQALLTGELPKPIPTDSPAVMVPVYRADDGITSVPNCGTCA
jgi:hypothetical protein